LIRFCGNTTVSIKQSSIKGVMTAQAPDLEKVLCIRHSSRVALQNSVISSNNATAVEVAHDAWLQVLGSTLAANTGNELSGGVDAYNNSTVVVGDGSVISGNTALRCIGGGVDVRGSAVFVLSGASRVVNNTSVGFSGGGVAVSGDAQVRIEGGSIVCNNTSVGPAVGGGIAVGERGQLALVGGSLVCNNTAVWGGGGIAVGHNATATIREHYQQSDPWYGWGHCGGQQQLHSCV
jgi:hypothetical protein